MTQAKLVDVEMRLVDTTDAQISEEDEFSAFFTLDISGKDRAAYMRSKSASWAHLNKGSQVPILPPLPNQARDSVRIPARKHLRIDPSTASRTASGQGRRLAARTAVRSLVSAERW